MLPLSAGVYYEEIAYYNYMFSMHYANNMVFAE